MLFGWNFIDNNGSGKGGSYLEYSNNLIVGQDKPGYC